MPIFTRFCPVDWHTCSRRECQDPADCQYPPQPNSDPQKAWDEMHPPIPKPENDYMCLKSELQQPPCYLGFGFLNICPNMCKGKCGYGWYGSSDRFQRFLDVLTGVRSSSECPTLEELEIR